MSRICFEDTPMRSLAIDGFRRKFVTCSVCVELFSLCKMRLDGSAAIAAKYVGAIKESTYLVRPKYLWMVMIELGFVGATSFVS